MTAWALRVKIVKELARPVAVEPNINKKRKVYPVNGAVTAYIRKRWGINKIRANGDLHHAIDATVVACILNGLTDRKVLVHLLGGDLVIEWDEDTNHVFMTGPATEVFSGEYNG